MHDLYWQLTQPVFTVVCCHLRCDGVEVRGIGVEWDRGVSLSMMELTDYTEAIHNKT